MVPRPTPCCLTTSTSTGINDIKRFFLRRCQSGQLSLSIVFVCWQAFSILLGGSTLVRKVFTDEFIYSLEQRALNNLNYCLNTNIYPYLDISGGQSYNLYLNVVQFFNPGVNKTSVAA